MTHKQAKREALLESIYDQHPQLKADPLKAHMLTQMVDCYITDPDFFKKKTAEHERWEQKGWSKPQVTPIPSEIQCITCVPAAVRAKSV
jgi:hypothetical protein